MIFFFVEIATLLFVMRWKEGRDGKLFKFNFYFFKHNEISELCSYDFCLLNNLMLGS